MTKPLTLSELVTQFQQDYADAPQFKGYSQALRKSIPPKSQVQSEFISNLETMQIVTDDKAIEDKISRILKKFE